MAAIKAAQKAEEDEAKRVRELQRQQDEATRLKAANWEESAAIADQKLDERRKKEAERRQAKIAKAQVSEPLPR